MMTLNFIPQIIEFEKRKDAEGMKLYLAVGDSNYLGHFNFHCLYACNGMLHYRNICGKISNLWVIAETKK